jgi:hypothetical protein
MTPRCRPSARACDAVPAASSVRRRYPIGSNGPTDYRRCSAVMLSLLTAGAVGATPLAPGGRWLYSCENLRSLFDEHVNPQGIENIATGLRPPTLAARISRACPPARSSARLVTKRCRSPSFWPPALLLVSREKSPRTTVDEVRIRIAEARQAVTLFRNASDAQRVAFLTLLFFNIRQA